MIVLKRVGVPIPLFEAGLRLPTSDLFNMIVDHYGFFVDELTPCAVNKIEDFVLAVAGMSVAWRARGKMAQLYVVRRGAEAEISLEMVMRGHYRGKLYHREIDLALALPPYVSERRMRDFTGFFSAEGRNTGSSGPASPSQSTIGVVSPVRLPVPASSSFHAGYK
ncbi:unnamed protein product [Lactuca saligna]|uniref:Uncharacterized protein n=1 Tax=Lactuca saligna TaxID=75948 RepID=A0AA35Y8G4_LACSI|nr:unnamed protein product [Lactuca saligna]